MEDATGEPAGETSVRREKQMRRDGTSRILKPLRSGMMEPSKARLKLNNEQRIGIKGGLDVWQLRFG